MDYSELGKIVSVYWDDRKIKLTCEKDSIEIVAYSDCCSCSWLEYPNEDMNILKGHIISKIYEDTSAALDLPPSEVQDCDKNHLVVIELNGMNYEFILCNSSNGYYDGWFEVSKTSTGDTTSSHYL